MTPVTVDGAWFVVARWGTFAGVLLLLGGAIAGRTFLKEAPNARRVSVGRMLGWGASAALFAGLCRLILQLLAVFGGEHLSWQDVGSVLASGWGHAWMLQQLSIAVLLVCELPAHDSLFDSSRRHWGMGSLVAMAAVLRRTMSSASRKSLHKSLHKSRALVGMLSGMLLALATARGGHAAGTANPWFTMIVDGVHLLAVSAWIGGLVFLLSVQPERWSLGAHRAVLAQFSRLARVMVPIALATGVTLAWMHDVRPEYIGSSRYGLRLLWKLMLVLLVLVFGGFNWQVLQPRLARGGRRWLRIAGWAEVVFASAVLLLTAVLVATDTPA